MSKKGDATAVRNGENLTIKSLVHPNKKNHRQQQKDRNLMIHHLPFPKISLETMALSKNTKPPIMPHPETISSQSLPFPPSWPTKNALWK